MWAIYVLLVVLLLGGTLPLVSRLLGHPFLPSQEYADRYSDVGTALTLLAGLGSFYLLLFTDILDRAAERRKTEKYTPFRKLIMALSAPFLVASLVHDLVFGSYPIAHARFAGENVALRYTAEDATRRGDGKCPSPVVLASMPFMLDKVCFVPEDFRKQLKPGMRIELLGRGTADGLFYERLRIAAPEGQAAS